MSSSYRIALDNWLSRLDVEGSVLDIGGAQLPVKGRTRSWKVDEYVIADLPSPHKGPKPAIEFNLEEDIWRDKIFDIVFCLEVFDYIVRPEIALGNLREMGKTIYASFPFLYPTHQPLEHEGLRYTENSIRRLAELTGLTVQNMIPRRPETNAIERLWRDERMRAAKNYDHNVTGWIVELR